MATSSTGSLHLNRKWLENALKFIEDVYILPQEEISDFDLECQSHT